MSQNCLKFWDKFETKLRTDLRPYRDNFETYLTILLLRANWDLFETWVHSDAFGMFGAYFSEAIVAGAIVGVAMSHLRSICRRSNCRRSLWYLLYYLERQVKGH